MARRDAIIRDSIGLDYAKYATGAIAFDYEALLADTGYDLEAIRSIQSRTAVPVGAGSGSAHLREGRGRQSVRLLQGPPGVDLRPRGGASRLRRDRRGDQRKLRGRRRLPGRQGRAALHHRAGGLRRPRRRTARDRGEDTRLRGLRRRSDPAVRGPRALRRLPARARGDGLLQRLSLHALLGPRHRDAGQRAGRTGEAAHRTLSRRGGDDPRRRRQRDWHRPGARRGRSPSTASPSPPATRASRSPSPAGPTGPTCRATRRARSATWTASSR
jgi:hypothetical protein